MLLPILISVSYFFACFGVTLVAGNRMVSAQNIFHIAVIFTPLIALLVIILSPKKKVVQSKMIVCRNCVCNNQGNNVSNPECKQKGILEMEEPNYS